MRKTRKPYHLITEEYLDDGWEQRELGRLIHPELVQRIISYQAYEDAEPDDCDGPDMAVWCLNFYTVLGAQVEIDELKDKLRKFEGGTDDRKEGRITNGQEEDT